VESKKKVVHGVNLSKKGCTSENKRLKVVGDKGHQKDRGENEDRVDNQKSYQSILVLTQPERAESGGKGPEERKRKSPNGGNAIREKSRKSEKRSDRKGNHGYGEGGNLVGGGGRRSVKKVNAAKGSEKGPDRHHGKKG